MVASSQGLADHFAIDLATQQVFPLSELPNHAPGRGGRKLHKATPFRWAKGVRAKDGSIVPCPTIQIGGTRYTSLEAFQWFCERLSARPAAEMPNSTARGKSAERAARELDRIGI